MGLLFDSTVGLRPFKLPDATKTVPSGMVWAVAYQRALASLFPGSFQSWPLRLASDEDLCRYRIAVNPSPMFGSSQVNGALPPTEMTRPSAKKVPPEQKAFVK